MKEFMLLFTGILIGFISSFVYKKNNEKYIYTTNKYNIENVGYIDKGTLLKIDQSYSEGFTRYILYVNLKGTEDSIVDSDKWGLIKPYWLNPVNDD